MSEPLWPAIRRDAGATADAEPLLARFLFEQVLQHARFESAVAHVVSCRLGGGLLEAGALRALVEEVLQCDPAITGCIEADIRAVCERDPACGGPLDPLLHYKGLHALIAYRVGHWLWCHGRRPLARWLQSRVAQCLAVDIHPAARIGRGILLDHAHGVVVGETAVVEDQVSILHNVTLGGTGKDSGDRHPKVRSGVLIGAGALILGNIEIGSGAKVGAGSVVMRPVRPHVTVAGQLARAVGIPATLQPSLEMNHQVEPRAEQRAALREADLLAIEGLS
jgi:serine O-acetyltransferase